MINYTCYPSVGRGMVVVNASGIVQCKMFVSLYRLGIRDCTVEQIRKPVQILFKWD
jgi:hypothetical protein